MSKTYINYQYKGHSIKVTETSRGPFWIEVKGPHYSLMKDTYSLDHLERAIEQSIDSAISKAASKS